MLDRYAVVQRIPFAEVLSPLEIDPLPKQVNSFAPEVHHGLQDEMRLSLKLLESEVLCAPNCRSHELCRLLVRMPDDDWAARH